MRFEIPLIAAIGLLVTGILISIAMGPEEIPVPLEMSDETKTMAEPAPESMAEPEPEPLPISVTVSLPEGSGSPGCETSNECFIPYSVEIAIGGEVTWSNDDVAAHTVTSGTVDAGPDGLFDSSLFLSGTTFSQTFPESGTFDYYCMVHPWMVGQVTVN